MQTAARAVLDKESGLYAEPEGPYLTHFVKSTDPQYVAHVCEQIARSWGMNPRRLVIAHGHKPDKQGNFVMGALGHDLNIDAGTAAAYGANGAFLLVGTGGLFKFSLTDHSFSEVNLRPR